MAKILVFVAILLAVLCLATAADHRSNVNTGGGSSGNANSRPVGSSATGRSNVYGNANSGGSTRRGG